MKGKGTIPRHKKDRMDKMGLVKNVIRKTDLVVQVLDARDPYGTRCKYLEDYAKSLGKKMLFVINKSDLVDRQLLEQHKRSLSGRAPTHYLSAKEKKGISHLKKIILEKAPHLPAKVSIIGYPNVGKSLLSNALKGRTAAKVAPVPGFTKSQQWVRVSEEILLYDTPGVIPFSEKESTLAIKGAIEADSLKNPIDAASEIILKILAEKPVILAEVYGIQPEQEPEKIIEQIAIARGRLLKGGAPNMEEAAKLIVRDWYKGKLRVQQNL